MAVILPSPRGLARGVIEAYINRVPHGSTDSAILNQSVATT